LLLLFFLNLLFQCIDSSLTGSQALRDRQGTAGLADLVVKTPIYKSFIDPKEMDGTLATFDSFHPIGRIGRIGSPEDVANTIFLLLEALRWVQKSQS